MQLARKLQKRINIWTPVFTYLMPDQLKWLIQYCICLTFRLPMRYLILLNELFIIYNGISLQLIISIWLIPTSSEKGSNKISFKELSVYSGKAVMSLTVCCINQWTAETFPASVSLPMFQRVLCIFLECGNSIAKIPSVPRMLLDIQIMLNYSESYRKWLFRTFS